MSPGLLLALVFGYLLGSIPFGLLLTRAAGMGDVRKIGSGNIGATNVLRTGNKGLAALTLALDMLKGTAAVLIAGFYGPEYAFAAGAAAFVGHLYPVWLDSRVAKALRPILACFSACLEGCAVVCRRVDRGCLLAALFFAGGAARYACRPHRALFPG